MTDSDMDITHNQTDKSLHQGFSTAAGEAREREEKAESAERLSLNARNDSSPKD